MGFIKNSPMYGPPAPTPGTNYYNGPYNTSTYSSPIGPRQPSPSYNSPIGPQLPTTSTGYNNPVAGRTDFSLFNKQPLLNRMAPPNPTGPGMRPLAKLQQFGGKVSSFFAAANPILAGIGAVAGFFSARSARKRARQEARARKDRAIKSEDLLVGAARNVAARTSQQQGFLKEEYNIGNRAGIQSQYTNIGKTEAIFGTANIAGAGSQDMMTENLENNYSNQFDMAKLGLDKGMDTLARGKESELRGIEGNLLELSAYSKRNMSVLGMIGGSVT